jgi:hypothetical protein
MRSPPGMILMLDDTNPDNPKGGMLSTMDMLSTMATILLLLGLGLCVVLFPFVLWMIFGDP